LTALVAKMLPVDKGIYRIQARPSGKYMAVDNGSTLDGAIVEQQGALTTGADQWRLVLQNGKHRFINVKSGKCLTAQLRSERGQRRDSPEGLLDIGMYSWYGTSPAPTREFEFAQTGEGFFAIRNKWLEALTVSGSSLANDARVTPLTWNGPSQNHCCRSFPEAPLSVTGESQPAPLKGSVRGRGAAFGASSTPVSEGLKTSAKHAGLERKPDLVPR
jgi:hypothetical protein